VIKFTVDTSEITALQKSLAVMIGKYDKITAIAMTKAAASAKDHLAANVLPRIQGGPSNWTVRGLRYWRADRDRLVAAVGWNYGDNSPVDIGFTPKGRGVPSGRYMETLSRGGDRRPKSTELSMRRAGVIRGDQFITPASSGVTLNAQGNLPGAEYRRILSRIKAAAGSGFTSNASNSKRSRRRRAQSDFFPRYGQLGEGASYIARRIGDGPKGGTGKGSGRPGRPQTVGYRRGFVPALFVVDQPNYERRFDIHGIAWGQYSRVFPGAFKAALEAELARR
jgi:hypothetical protein